MEVSMKKLYIILLVLTLSSCNTSVDEEFEPKTKVLAPLEIEKYDYDSFSLKGHTFKLPASYKDFSKNGLSLKKDQFYQETIDKNQQLMTGLSAKDYSIGVTFKNTTDLPIDTSEATIIEIYINSNNNMNKDFRIANLTWGSSYTKAKESLSNFKTEEATNDNNRTLTYYTDVNYVSLYFSDDKLSSVAIFSKPYMRDENYVGGEFIVFGQDVKFPLALADLEHLLSSSFDVDVEDEILSPGEKINLKLKSPILSDEDSDENNLEFTIQNINGSDVYYKDANIISISSNKSSDLSVGNLYVGADNKEIKIMDKKNQNPARLSITGHDGTDAIVDFLAENNTRYRFYMNSQYITKIEVINENKE